MAERSWADAFKNLGQALGGAAAIGAQKAFTPPRRRPQMPGTPGAAGPKCTPCRANAMVQAAADFGRTRGKR